MRKSIIVLIMDDAKATALSIEESLHNAGIEGYVMEVNMKHKYNEFVIRVDRKGFLFPRDDEW